MDIISFLYLGIAVAIILYFYIELIQLLRVVQQIIQKINPLLDQFIRQAFRVTMIIVAVTAIFAYFVNRYFAYDPGLPVDSKLQQLN